MNTILNYDLSFRLGGYDLSGVSSIGLASDFGVGFIPTLGNKSFGMTKVSPSKSSLSMNRSLIYDDPVLGYTGDSPCSGIFTRNSISYGFSSGFLTNYSISCSVGQVPSTSTSFSIYGKIQSGLSQQNLATHPEIFIPSPKSIVISNDFASSNRAIGFDYSLEIPRKPIYSVNSIYPDFVLVNGPRKISASITYEIKGFLPLEVDYFVSQLSTPNFSVNIKNRALTSTISSFQVYNAQIISQKIDSNADTPQTLTLEYEGFLDG